MAATLEQLIAKLGNQTPYEGMTQEEILQEAGQRYQSVYDQQRLSARQAYETSDAALARELGSLQQSYDRQRAQSAAQTEDTYRQADRHALSRGMQRSSYNNATLANIDLAGDAALNAISREQTAKENEIGEQRTLLSRQLAAQLKQYDDNQHSDTLAYADELEAREYDRRVQSASAYNELSMKLYEYQHQLEQEAVEQQRWLAEFNAKYGGDDSAPSAGSSRRSGKSASSNGNAAKSTSTKRTLKNQTVGFN